MCICQKERENKKETILYCSVLQCVAVCGSVLQRVAVCCSVHVSERDREKERNDLVLHCVALCCSVLQCACVRKRERESKRRSYVGELRHKRGERSKCVAVCCSVLQCVAACCSVLQSVTAYWLLRWRAET